MPPIRILIVDDSVVVRKLVSDQLGDVPGLEVMGSAPNGKIALQKIERDRPDLVVLDVEMPVMGGLETLREIKKRDRSIVVVMFSSFTTAGAQVTVDALTLGAEDYVAKPSDLLSAGAGAQAIRTELVAKIRLLTGAKQAVPTAAKAPAAPTAPAPAAAAPPRRVDVVAIGSSTGGPNALAELFSRFPANLPVPILIVQHMPAVFTPHLAERLSRESVLTVQEAEEGLRALPGHAYIAPGGRHLTVSRRADHVFLHLNDDPPVHSCRPAADVLFSSVQEAFGNRALAVVLTGMGEDGLVGAQGIHDAGGRVLIQDEASSVVWGMAGAVARVGIADAALPLEDLAEEIVRRMRVGRLR